jgi:hypothetical protein
VIGLVATMQPAREVIEAGGRITTAGTGMRQLAIHIGASIGAPNYYCELFDDGVSVTLLMTWTDGTSFFTINAVVVGGRLDTSAYRLLFVHTPPDLQCIAWWKGARYELTGADPGTITPDVMYLGVTNVDTEVDYFVRMSTP